VVLFRAKKSKSAPLSGDVTVRVQEGSLDVRTLGLVASDRVLDSGDLSADFFWDYGLFAVRV
jgi:hypothetical protein